MAFLDQLYSALPEDYEQYKQNLLGALKPLEEALNTDDEELDKLIKEAKAQTVKFLEVIRFGRHLLDRRLIFLRAERSLRIQQRFKLNDPYLDLEEDWKIEQQHKRVETKTNKRGESKREKMIAMRAERLQKVLGYSEKEALRLAEIDL